ncbi:hypothetical protein OKW21_002085 [Catalinimonas alkaloidigena]|nr:hypothetical protein [Catalinimonas alkaloidigena]
MSSLISGATIALLDILARLASGMTAEESYFDIQGV